MQDVLPNGVVFPHQFAGVLIERDYGRRQGRGNVHVAFILPVRGADVDQVPLGDWGRIGHVALVDADFLHHVKHPKDVGIGLFGELLLGEESVARAVVEALDIECDNLAAIENSTLGADVFIALQPAFQEAPCLPTRSLRSAAG